MIWLHTSSPRRRAAYQGDDDDAAAREKKCMKKCRQLLGTLLGIFVINQHNYRTITEHWRLSHMMRRLVRDSRSSLKVAITTDGDPSIIFLDRHGRINLRALRSCHKFLQQSKKQHVRDNHCHFSPTPSKPSAAADNYISSNFPNLSPILHREMWSRTTSAPGCPLARDCPN